MPRRYSSGKYLITLDPKATEEQIRLFLSLIVEQDIFVGFEKVEET